MGTSDSRKSHGGGRGKHRSPWLVLAAFGAIIALWAVTSIILIPQELSNIGSSVEPRTAHISTRLDVETRRESSPAGDDVLTDVQIGTYDAGIVPRLERTNQLSVEEIMDNMSSFLDELHEAFATLAEPNPEKIWNIYKGAADQWLLPMDRDNEGRGMFDVRDDESIFVSVASYRDENCPKTLEEMFSKAARPNLLYIGLVQQNCESNCRSGVLEGNKVEDVDPDINCYDAFCATELGQQYCNAGHIRDFFVQESESLGPAVARYFASKLWEGQNFFMQIDAHSLFEPDWDMAFISDIKNTPSYPRSALSHYPPDTKRKYQREAGCRICGAEFAKSPIEYQIIRLAAGISHDKSIQTKPCPAPFAGAGFFFAHASFLQNMPFDPYVPYVFMGEELLLSLRLWTWGYNIYSPTRNMLSHFYVRRHTPKFWETVRRVFHVPSMHNDLTNLIIDRVKSVAGYPESSEELVKVPSLLDHLDLYGDGPVRAMEDFMLEVGLDMNSKTTKRIDWCFACAEPYPL